MSTREVLETMYGAAAAGDFETLQGLLDPELVVEEPPFLPYGGTYEGFEAFAGVFTEASKVIDISAIEVDGITAHGELGYAAVRVPLVATGEIRELVEEWRVVDGRIVHGRILWFDPSL